MQALHIKIRDTRRKGFFTIDNEAVDVMAKVIGYISFAIYIVLCRHADKNEESFPSQDSIAEKLGLNPRTVLEKTKILEQTNMISIEKVRDGKTGEFLHNTYTLLDKSMWTPTAPGIQVQSDSTRVEAKPRCSETHPNNTHEKNKTNIENFEIPNDLDSQEAKSLLPVRSADRKKVLGGFGSPSGSGSRKGSSFPNYPRKTGTVAPEDLL